MTPADKHRTAASEKTPRVTFPCSVHAVEQGMQCPYCELSTANARLERLMELAREVIGENAEWDDPAAKALRAELEKE